MARGDDLKALLADMLYKYLMILKHVITSTSFHLCIHKKKEKKKKHLISRKELALRRMP